jgi:hypothetical protein
MFLEVSDFTGKFQLHTGMYDQSKLESYIERYEKKYLVQLFGVELYNDFMGDIDAGMPQSPNFIKIFNPFNEQIDMLNIAMSEGILDMLKGFIYFEYAKDLINQMTPFGNVAQQSENSSVVTPLYSMMYARYNESVKTYRAIQTYMIYNSSAPTGQILQIWFPQGGVGYTSDLIQASWTGGSGTGYKSDVQMELVGGVKQDVTILTGGTGYSNGDILPTTGGAGSGCSALILTIAGVVTDVTIEHSGQGYALNDVLTIAGGSATFKVNGLGIGSVYKLSNTQAGINYKIGDVLTLPGVATTKAQMGVLYVGLGDYRKLKGNHLQYAYWL